MALRIEFLNRSHDKGKSLKFKLSKKHDVGEEVDLPFHSVTLYDQYFKFLWLAFFAHLSASCRSNYLFISLSTQYNNPPPLSHFIFNFNCYVTIFE